MIATKKLSGYLDEYLEEKQEIKNLTSETIKKQTFNINQFINYLENEGIEELDSTNVKKQLRHYRRYCLKGRGNKRTTVKTYMMNILEFINSEEVQEEIQHDPIKMKDIIEVKVEDPETAKKRIEKISLNSQQSDFLLETIDDYSELIYELERFLPFVDNWATCDMMSPKIFKKHLDKLCYEVDRLISSSYTYSVRYGINILMKYYLDEHFEQKYLDKVEKIRSDEYYINMMRAWYFATALAKQYDVTIKLFEKNVLDTWTHNKAIQKAVESNRIKADTKLYLKTLKIK